MDGMRASMQEFVRCRASQDPSSEIECITRAIAPGDDNSMRIESSRVCENARENCCPIFLRLIWIEGQRLNNRGGVRNVESLLAIELGAIGGSDFEMYLI